MRVRMVLKTLLLTLVVVFLFNSPLLADGLVGWWKFDEGQGETVADSSGHGNDGKIFGVTSWVDGYVGKGALKIIGGGVKIADSPLLRPPQVTVAMWVNFSGRQVPSARLFQKGNDNRETINIQGGEGGIGFSLATAPRENRGVNARQKFEIGKWYHITGTYDGSEIRIYVNGKVVNKQTVGSFVPYAEVGEPLVIGNRPPDMARPLNAIVDDVRIYNRPLSDDEVWQLYAWKGRDPHIAVIPKPAERATNLMPSQVLGWMAGAKAASHRVYFGTDYNSVKNATTSSRQFKGLTDVNSFNPGQLQFGQSYYWRIDEISGGKTWKGDVWSFTVIGGKAGSPSPGKTLKNVPTDAKLSWTRGVLAVSHELYFGTNADEVAKATTSSRVYKGSLPLGVEAYDPGPLKKGTYYYWRVDERCKEGVAKGDVWKFRTKGGKLVLQVDLAVPTCDLKGIYPGTAKPGWTIWADRRWADMYMHDYVWFPANAKEPNSKGIDGTGVRAFLTTGSEGQLGIGVKGVCRNNLGGGGCPKGKAQGDPIANSWAYAVDWAGPYAGDIMLVLENLPPGVYELRSYHNHWEPCTQKTRNCLDCVCGMPPMPSITANPLPKGPLPGYKCKLPPGTGKGVRAIKNAYNVAPQHVYSDDKLVPSIVQFETDGSPVLIIYQADRTKPLYPDCARPGREGARGILNAFELIQLGVSAPVCSAAKIADRIGKWRVEVGPAGNEFYQPPQKKKIAVPPSAAVLRYPAIFVPHIKVSKWDFDDGEYEIRCKRGDEEYKFDVTPQGELTELRYGNDATNIDEEADELVLRGTKKGIAVNNVPKRALSALAEAYPNIKPAKAWTAETLAGPRYVIQIGEMAFYARPDGQIQAGRGIHDGGLNEIYPPGKKRDEKEFKAELKKLLGPYRERFNFQNQIRKLGKSPKSADGSYRYVVMGDNRSNWDLWSSMVRHINGLVPKPAFVINSGDIVPKGYAREFYEYYIPPLLKTDIPFFVAIGNHETGDDDMAREFRYLFGRNSLNYYFDYGKARYVFFDNASDASSPKKTLKWLDKTLADTPKGYRKYVAMHKPPKTIKKWAYHSWKKKESKVFTDLMTKHHVSEVYLGHIHAYSTAKFGGVNYTLSGGAGAHLHNRYGPKGNVYHYVICDVLPDGTVKQQVVRFYDVGKESK